MKDKKIFYILLAVLIVFFVSFLYQQEKIQKKEAGNKYTVTAFSSTKNSFDPTKESQEALEFFIENSSKEKRAYQIKFFKNNQEVKEETISIRPQSRKIINTPKEILQGITGKNQNSFVYKAKISWGGSSRDIYKRIFIEEN
jgi:hypothetical protein